MLTVKIETDQRKFTIESMVFTRPDWTGYRAWVKQHRETPIGAGDVYLGTTGYADEKDAIREGVEVALEAAFQVITLRGVQSRREHSVTIPQSEYKHLHRIADERYAEDQARQEAEEGFRTAMEMLF